MSTIAMKEARLFLIMMDFGIKDGVFKTKVFNRYGTFDWITNESMKDLGYTYLHCEFVGLGNFDHNHFDCEIASYKNAWTTFVKGYVCEGQKIWHLIKIQKGIEKGDMHIVITIPLITILCHQFFNSNLNWFIFVALGFY